MARAPAPAMLGGMRPLIGACFVVTAGAATAAEAPRVLVTGFEAFAGRGVNGSATLARSLEGARIAGYEVRAAVLPVVWDGLEGRLAGLLRTHRPALVLGLGEGRPGRVEIETVGRNRAAGIDERGAPPPEALLEPQGPASRAARLAFDPAWFDGSDPPVIASADAGAYLCNHLLFTGLRVSGERPMGFVHLPPQGAETDERYLARLRPAILALLERNLSATAAP